MFREDPRCSSGPNRLAGISKVYNEGIRVVSHDGVFGIKLAPLEGVLIIILVDGARLCFGDGLARRLGEPVERSTQISG